MGKKKGSDSRKATNTKAGRNRAPWQPIFKEKEVVLRDKNGRVLFDKYTGEPRTTKQNVILNDRKGKGSNRIQGYTISRIV